MEATRMITGNYAQTNTASSSNQAGAAGNTSFTQTLVQVLQDDSSAGSSAPLIGTLMPGLLTGPNVPNQEPAQDAAGALLQLLTQLLNGEQKAVSTGTSEAEIEAAE
ncbi:MAG: hypothetical protein K0R67_1010, partial [Paenibacillus sp.]|nr:hypothetical protein [Paenibacillus sp.]